LKMQKDGKFNLHIKEYSSAKNNKSL